MAPIASNSSERVQSTSSQPPAKTMSCRPAAISPAPTPIQWVEVAQAEVMEKLTPLILNQVESVADGPELIAFGTANGPIRLTPLLRAMSADSTMARVDGPPDPTTSPVRS